MGEAFKMKTTVNVEAFDVPDLVAIVPDEGDERSDGHCLIGLQFVDLDTVDKLAERWLGALYANCNQPSPFRLVRGDQVTERGKWPTQT